MEFSARYALAGSFVLATILAVFGFIYWLMNTSGLGETAPVNVRFSVPVSGLSRGSDVLFNGLKVGEVTALHFDPARPDTIIARVNVSVNAPLRADTHVGIAFQGLTGAASILLTGGQPQAGAPQTGADGVPVLDADPIASRSWTDNAGRVLGRLDDVLNRNSGRFDAILSGLERLAGGGTDEKSAGVLDLPLPQFPSPNSAAVSWQLVIAEPTVLLSLNTDKVQEMRKDGALYPITDAKWVDNLPNLFHAKFIRAFEDAGYSRSVLRPADVLDPQWKLAVDIRAFHVSKDADAMAKGDITAKLLDSSGAIVATLPLMLERPEASDGDEAASIAALQELFADLASRLVQWTIAELANAG